MSLLYEVNLKEIVELIKSKEIKKYWESRYDDKTLYEMAEYFIEFGKNIVNSK